MRCPKCNKRLIAEANDAGRSGLRCLKCDAVDPLKTEAAKWAESSLAQPPSILARPLWTMQAVEHYEIARYGTLIAWAEELGHDDIVRFLTD